MWNIATERIRKRQPCPRQPSSTGSAPRAEGSRSLTTALGRFLAGCAALLLATAALAAEQAAMLTVGMGSGRPATIDASLVEKLARNMAAEHEHADRFDAQVWLAASEQRLSRYLKSRDERLELLKTVYREAHRQNLDPDLVLAVMQVESAFDRYAISRVGAQGLMQVMPFWRLEIGRPQDNLTELETNVRYGTTILAHYLEVSGQDLVDALARYNGSRGRLKYPEKVVGAWRKRWRNKTAAELPVLMETCATYRLSACQYN